MNDSNGDDDDGCCYYRDYFFFMAEGVGERIYEAGFFFVCVQKCRWFDVEHCKSTSVVLVYREKDLCVVLYGTSSKLEVSKRYSQIQVGNLNFLE